MWVEFVVGSDGFFAGFPVFLPPAKTNTSKFQFEREFDRGPQVCQSQDGYVQPSFSKQSRFILFISHIHFKSNGNFPFPLNINTVLKDVICI